MLPVLILAGGQGTRFAEETKTKPKPMIEIDNVPILIHIINIYTSFQCKTIYILTGYLSEVIEEFFSKSNNFQKIENNEFKYKSSKIRLIFTGNKTMTGGRIKQAIELTQHKEYFLTYGDGLSSVNLLKLYKHHKKNNKIGTVTAVRPPARFGSLDIEGNMVKSFGEKLQSRESWINGGYFVVSSEINNYIGNEMQPFESTPLTNLATDNQLTAFKHYGFWQCVDTIHEKDYLETIISKEKKLPWIES